MVISNISRQQLRMKLNCYTLELKNTYWMQKTECWMVLQRPYITTGHVSNVTMKVINVVIVCHHRVWLRTSADPRVDDEETGAHQLDEDTRHAEARYGLAPEVEHRLWYISAANENILN